MQTVLIAGGAGFIGSHLCKQLLKMGYKVICIDNLITGSKSNIDSLLTHEHFQFLSIDVTQPFDNQLQNISGLDAIFHLASPASPNKNSRNSYINKPLETMLANSVGTYRLLELAKQHKALFLFASTSEVYGDPAVSPQPESYWGNVNPNGIRSVYDEGKRFGEAMTMSYLRSFEVDARIIRIFNTYGPHMQPDDGRVVSNFIVECLQNKPITIYGDGTQTRSFCYVSDMVEGIIKAMFSPQTKGSVINLGNPNEKTIAELATLIKNLTESSSTITHEPLPEDDPKIRRPNISLATKLLNWSPTVSIEDGLRLTIEYFKKV